MLNMALQVNITLPVPNSWWERMLCENTQGEQRKSHVILSLFEAVQKLSAGRQTQEAIALHALAKAQS